MTIRTINYPSFINDEAARLAKNNHLSQNQALAAIMVLGVASWRDMNKNVDKAREIINKTMSNPLGSLRK